MTKDEATNEAIGWLEQARRERREGPNDSGVEALMFAQAYATLAIAISIPEYGW